MHFKAFQDEGIEPKLEYNMEQQFRVSIAQGVLRFTPIQHEKETVYTPSPPLGLNVGNAPYDCDDEMSENSAFNHRQDNREWQEVWNDNSPIPSPTPPQSTEHGVIERGSKRVSENDASESSKNCRIETGIRVEGAGMLMEKLDAIVKVVTRGTLRIWSE